MPNPMASNIGKPKDQKSASGSRRYSRKRTSTSWRSGLSPCCSVITQLTPGARNEHVLERCRMRRQLRELQLPRGEKGEQRRNGLMQRSHLQLVFAGDRSCYPHAVERSERCLVDRRRFRRQPEPHHV